MFNEPYRGFIVRLTVVESSTYLTGGPFYRSMRLKSLEQIADHYCAALRD